ACAEDDKRYYNMHHRLTLGEIEQAMAAYAAASVDVPTVLQKMAMQFEGWWEPVELKQLAQQGLSMLKNNEIARADQTIRHVALWHPNWPEVAIGLTNVL
ncbi:MAG: hypothetical protein HKN50_11835, partial [Gammaproteobacteria bacterium]|nr:hypothetical protein [Gammaproteobacteria bacterium]